MKMWRKIAWMLPSALGLLGMAGLNSSVGTAIATPSPATLAQAQTEASFRVGQQIAVRFNNQYYAGTVTRVSQENGFTRVDYRWFAGSMSGGGYTFPAFYGDVLTIEEAARQGLAIANATASPLTTDSPAIEEQPTPEQVELPQNNVAASTTASTEILAAHNRYRQELNLPLLVWSDALASDAQSWANQLAAMGGSRLVHASSEQRNGQGENLWMGTTGFYSYTDMMDGGMRGSFSALVCFRT